LLLQQLVRARDACLSKARTAPEDGTLRAGLSVFDAEHAELVESIQFHCAHTGLPLPEGVPPLTIAAVTSPETAQRILESDVRLLELRRLMLATAEATGDAETALRMASAIRHHEEAVRKHCERAQLPLPPELSKT
jgi:hypothetical protein